MILTQAQRDARICLAEGMFLVNPIYAHDPAKQEEWLKGRCLKCLHCREHWPAWVEEYAKKWEAAKKARDGK